MGPRSDSGAHGVAAVGAGGVWRRMDDRTQCAPVRRSRTARLSDSEARQQGPPSASELAGTCAKWGGVAEPHVYESAPCPPPSRDERGGA